jgi:1-acyl-sn-glycerol-3-phosphate acyltransferase
MKPQVYIDPRPAEFFDKYHERVRTGRPDWAYRLTRLVLTGPILVGYRFRTIDSSNVPERGPVLLAPNHFSFWDHFFVAVLLRREVQFMAKSQLFNPALLGWYINHGGVFPVRRGQKDEEAFITAHAIFARGGTVLMYAEGGRSRSKELGQPKPGVGRLALEAGVPVVPVAVHGSEHVRDAKHRLRIPKVTVQYGEPLTFPQVDHPTREQSQEVADLVFARVRVMYEALTKQGRRGVLERMRQERRHGAPATG